MKALARNQRCLRKDLNRIWLPDRLAHVGAPGTALDDEDAELAAIDDEVARAIAKRRGQVVIFDLHCMSAQGPAFVTFDDTLANRVLALRIPSACALGLQEELHGTERSSMRSRPGPLGRAPDGPRSWAEERASTGYNARSAATAGGAAADQGR